MKHLSSDWLTGNWGDYELPRYQLLDYVKSIYTEFENDRLFPAWEGVYENYRKLKDLRSGLDLASDLQPREMTGLDPASAKVNYQTLPHAGWQELEIMQQRLDFAIPLLKQACKESEERRKQMEPEIEFVPLGLLVSNQREGLLLVTSEKSKEVWSWYYHCSVHTQLRGNYSALKTRLIGKFPGGYHSVNYVREVSAAAAGLKGLIYSSWLVRSVSSLPVVHTTKPLGVMRLASELGL